MKIRTLGSSGLPGVFLCPETLSPATENDILGAASAGVVIFLLLK